MNDCPSAQSIDTMLHVDEKNIFGSFRRIAGDLFSGCLIHCGERRYEITEVEFYYTSGNHDDPFTHGHDIQKEKGLWYFHDSGIDISIGSGGAAGGILIRGIQLFKSPVTAPGQEDGPLKVFDALFNTGHQVGEEFGFKLIAHDVRNDVGFVCCPRVGLGYPKGEERRLRYSVMPYRMLRTGIATGNEKYLLRLAEKLSCNRSQAVDWITTDKSTWAGYEQAFEAGKKKMKGIAEYLKKSKLSESDRAYLMGYFFDEINSLR